MSDERPDFDLVLLKVDPAAHPLYFVVKAYRNPAGHTPEHDAYFFNEHTCPTNWTSDIIGVVSRGDEDPHGCATFVKRITPPPGADVLGDWVSIEGDTTWRQLFPEIEVGHE